MALIGRSSKNFGREFVEEGKKKLEQGQGIAIGIALGLMVGLATDNIALWLCIGVALGAAYEGKSKVKKDKEEK